MDKDRNSMTEKILKLTLEIIYLLTGEDYAPVNNSTLHVTRSSVSQKSRQSCRTLTMDHSSQIDERNNDEKILELTNKIMELLTREVPIRFEDITVSFSMEEWEYIEGHKDLYKDVMMKDKNIDSSKDLNREDTEVENEQGLPSPPCIPNDASDIQAVSRKAPKWRRPRKRRTKYISKRKDKHGAHENMPRDAKPPENSTIHSESSTNEDGNFTSDVIHSDTNTHNPRTPSDNNESYPPNDQYTACRTEQQLSGTEENADIKPSPPEISSRTIEPPIDTLTTASYTPEQFAYTPIKEEPVTNYEPPQYPSTHDQEESWPKTNDPGANIYAVGLSQYTLADIKEESVFSEEESRNSFIYIPPEPARFTPKQVKVEPISREEGYEVYIPTDCAQRRLTSAPGQAKNRVQDAEKRNKGFSVTKYNAPRMSRQTTQVVDGMYVCATCEKSFTSHFGLVKHQAMHNGNKVSCPQCGKLFFYKSSLVIHQRIHTGEKLFACPVCNKCFTNNSNLVVHQRIHTGEKPFVCADCGKRFGHKGHLNRHLRTHETERPATNIENYGNSGLHDHWNAHKINGWSHNIYNNGPYSMYDKSV